MKQRLIIRFSSGGVLAFITAAVSPVLAQVDTAFVLVLGIQSQAETGINLNSQ